MQYILFNVFYYWLYYANMLFFGQQYFALCDDTGECIWTWNVSQSSIWTEEKVGLWWRIPSVTAKVRSPPHVCLEISKQVFLSNSSLELSAWSLRAVAELVGGFSSDLLPGFSLSGGKASWAGQTGFPQHTQEVNCLSAGPAGRGCGQEVCQVSLGEQQKTHHCSDHRNIKSTKACLSPEVPSPDWNGGL